jgi:hypothetical protein
MPSSHPHPPPASPAIAAGKNILSKLPSPNITGAHQVTSLLLLVQPARVILPPRTSGRKSKKPRILQPTENLRDHTVGYKNWAQTAQSEFHKACVERDKSTVESMTAQKKLFIKMDILTTDEYIFDAKVQTRLNEELPLFLKNLRPLEGSSKCISTGTDSYAHLIGYVKASFISYEIEIARLIALYAGFVRQKRCFSLRLQYPKESIEPRRGRVKPWRSSVSVTCAVRRLPSLKL